MGVGSVRPEQRIAADTEKPAAELRVQGMHVMLRLPQFAAVLLLAAPCVGAETPFTDPIPPAVVGRPPHWFQPSTPAQPSRPRPVATKPVAAPPVVSTPAPSKPSTSKAVAAKPGTSRTATSKPVAA